MALYFTVSYNLDRGKEKKKMWGERKRNTENERERERKDVGQEIK
jgi:hypothetical protein